MRKYNTIHSHQKRKMHLNRCLKTKTQSGGTKMVKIVRIMAEGKKLTPIQDAEKIKKAIADLDYRLESTGDMTAEIWNCLQDATAQLDKAIEWMHPLPAFE